MAFPFSEEIQTLAYDREEDTFVLGMVRTNDRGNPTGVDIGV